MRRNKFRLSPYFWCFMLYRNNPSQCSGAAVLAAMLATMWVENPIANLLRLAAVWFGRPVDGAIVWPSVGMVPQHCIIKSEQALLCLFNGVETPAMATTFVAGYQRPSKDATHLWFHDSTWEAANTVWPDVKDLFPVDAAFDVTVAGHSYGGTVASSIALAFTMLRRNSSVKLYTFGSPRCFTPPGALTIGGDLLAARYFMPRDPIPFLPPWESEVSGVTYAAAQLGGITGNIWSHLGAGFLMNEDGLLLPRNNPDALENPPTVMLSAWAVRALRAPVRAHLISTYASWLSRFLPIPADLPAAQPDVPDAGVPFAGPPVIPGFDPNKARTERVFEPFVGPPAPGQPQPDGPPYYSGKWQGRWYVWHWDTPIESASSSRTARKRAGDLNRVVAKFEEAPYADKIALLESLDAETTER